MAEGVGFEPTVLVRGRQFSRLVHSTALPPLRGCGLRAQATGKPDSGPEQAIQFASMARNPALRRTPAMDFWAGLLAGAGIAQSAPWMTAIKLAGGCYLLYLGITGLRSGARAASAGMPVRDMSASPMRSLPAAFSATRSIPGRLSTSSRSVAVSGVAVPTLLSCGAWIMLLRRHGGFRCARAGNCARLNAIARLAASGQTD